MKLTNTKKYFAYCIGEIGMAFLTLLCIVIALVATMIIGMTLYSFLVLFLPEVPSAILVIVLCSVTLAVLPGLVEAIKKDFKENKKD